MRWAAMRSTHAARMRNRVFAIFHHAGGQVPAVPGRDVVLDFGIRSPTLDNSFLMSSFTGPNAISTSRQLETSVGGSIGTSSGASS